MCNPVDKDGEDPSAPSHLQHLEAYVAAITRLTPRQPRPTPQVRTIENQFGTLKLKITTVNRVMVPSSKVLGTGGTPPLTLPTLDHFKCYTASVARAPKKQPPYPVFTPTTVTLTDQFGGPLLYNLLKPTLFCTPADTNSEDPLASTHAVKLVCYPTTRRRLIPPQPRFVRTRVSTNNQLGPEVIDATAIEALCVPSLQLD